MLSRVGSKNSSNSADYCCYETGNTVCKYLVMIPKFGVVFPLVHKAIIVVQRSAVFHY